MRIRLGGRSAEIWCSTNGPLGSSMALPDLEARVSRIIEALSIYSEELGFALRYIQPDASSSLTKSRIVLEKLLLRIYAIEMGQEPRKPLLGDMLLDNQFTRKIERRMLSRMNAIRDMANLGPHGEVVEPNDAARVLDDLCEVMNWYLSRYQAPPIRPSPVDHKQSPPLSANTQDAPPEFLPAPPAYEPEPDQTPQDAPTEILPAPSAYEPERRDQTPSIRRRMLRTTRNRRSSSSPPSTPVSIWSRMLRTTRSRSIWSRMLRTTRSPNPVREREQDGRSMWSRMLRTTRSRSIWSRMLRTTRSRNTKGSFLTSYEGLLSRMMVIATPAPKSYTGLQSRDYRRAIHKVQLRLLTNC